MNVFDFTCRLPVLILCVFVLNAVPRYCLFFSISNFEFNFLFSNFCKKKGSQYEEYFSSKLSKLSEKLTDKDFFCTF